ncbi:MAG: efflux RND transporter permease subunit [Bdellovibrionota bacterium]
MDLPYIQRPVAVIMITVGIMIFGIISFLRLPQTLLPDLNEPTLTVEAAYPDASPKEVERLITKPIEKSLGTLSGLKKIESFSQPSKSIVKLKFSWSHDIDRAIQEIREALDRQQFPDKAEKPKILRFDPSFEPIARISFSSETIDTVTIRAILDQNIKPVIETFPGIATSIIKGGREKEIAILFSKGSLEKFGIRPADIVQILREENISMPSGKFEHGEKETFVRVNSQFKSINEIGSLIINQPGNNAIHLSDITTIEERAIEPETLTRTNGQDAVFLDVYKEADANIISVVDSLRQAIDHQLIKFKWMKGINAQIVSDESSFIRKSISNVISAAIGGAILSMLILYFFLGELIPSILIGLAIPLAIPATFFLLDQKGISLNVMSLGGLALGIGMLVDNSIVVLENIAKKKNSSILLNAIEGTREMFLPVLASTLTTIAVFIPLAFVEGIAGQLFGDLAWTIIFSLSCSLVVAIVVLPTLYVLIHNLPTSETKSRDGLKIKIRWFALSKPYYQELATKGFRWFLDSKFIYLATLGKVSLIPWIIFKITFFLIIDILRSAISLLSILIKIIAKYALLLFSFLLIPVIKSANWCRDIITFLEKDSYPKLLNFVLKRKLNVIATVAILFAISIIMVQYLGGDLLPPLSQSRYFIDGEVPLGSGIRKTNSTSYAFEEKLKKTEGVSNVVALIGIDQAQALMGNAGVNKFTIQFDVDPMSFSKEILKESLSKIDGVNWTLRQPSLGIQSKPLEIVITNDSLEELKEASLKLKENLDKQPFLISSENTISSGVPELLVSVKPEILASIGLTPAKVINDLSYYLRGEKATQIELSDQTLPVNIRAEEKEVRGAQDLGNIKILTNEKQMIDLTSIASIKTSQSPSYIYRSSGARSIRLSYQPNGISLKEAKEHLSKIMPKNTLKTDYKITGQSEEYDESIASLIFAVGLAVFMVYLVMASQFESFLQPLFIMGSIPLAFIGVIFFIFPFNIPISIMVLVGCIVLVGIIVNNAIIFIDSVNKLIKDGSSIEKAVIETGRNRLRPILMTTSTTILGLIPMAFATGEGASLSIAMARSIIGGLGFGTLLTLVFIPILLTIFKKDPVTSVGIID